MKISDLDRVIEAMELGELAAQALDAHADEAKIASALTLLRTMRDNAVEGWAHDRVLDPPQLVDGTFSPRSTYFYEHHGAMKPDTKHTEGLVPALLLITPEDE